MCAVFVEGAEKFLQAFFNSMTLKNRTIFFNLAYLTSRLQNNDGTRMKRKIISHSVAFRLMPVYSMSWPHVYVDWCGQVRAVDALRPIGASRHFPPPRVPERMSKRFKKKSKLVFFTTVRGISWHSIIYYLESSCHLLLKALGWFWIG